MHSVLHGGGLTILVLLSELASALPRFADYRIQTVFTGRPAAPILTGWFWDYRTRIREGAKGTNFAGHFRIAEGDVVQRAFQSLSWTR